ncbi:MAG: hypothetical protein ACYTEX_25700 [Planctomycetota bacterium]|jgi:hypothetical protein
MEIHQIEAKTFAELKADPIALTEALKSQPAEVLAVRYFKHLMDAKHRDEKLSEQGKTITALQQGLEAAKAQAEAAALRVIEIQGEQAGLQAVLDDVRRSAKETIANNHAANAILSETAQQETARADRHKAAATRSYQAVAQAAKILADALGAQAVDAADKGE